MKTQTLDSQTATPTYGDIYQTTVPSSRSGHSGLVPGSSGVAPGTLPIDPLDPVVFGRLVALEADAPGFLAELVAEFESGVDRRMAAVKDAVRTGDLEALAFAAHSIRGSCGTVGAMRMAALAHPLEYGNPTRAQIRALVRQLTLEWDSVRRALDEVHRRPAA
jgi:HPt (histidine-containing phosphotransfer) domain-containing protein